MAGEGGPGGSTGLCSAFGIVSSGGKSPAVRQGWWREPQLRSWPTHAKQVLQRECVLGWALCSMLCMLDPIR